MYIDYDFYMNGYNGSIPEEFFQAAEQRAEACIRYLTYLNGDIFASVSDPVKYAVCLAADLYYADMKKAKTREAEGREGTVKSENNDGVSVSYVTEQVDGQTAEELLRKKVYDAVYMYLLPTGWLSRKVRCGHDHERGYNSL